MKIDELYRDPTIPGECLLRPFKASIKCFGYAFRGWTNEEKGDNHKLKEMGERVASFVIALLASISIVLVPIGLAIKFTARPEAKPSSLNQLEKLDELPIDQDHLMEALYDYPGDLNAQKLSLEIKDIDVSTLAITFKEHPGFLLTIRHQDLFKSGAQVIVNAANTHLGGGGGIDGEIHRRGGEAYVTAHRRLKNHYHGNYPSGYASMIEKGKIENIENIIVVAGPVGEATIQKESILYSCYYNSLLLAHHHGKKSIAFPTISTGIFGFPKERAAAISLRAVYDFIMAYSESSLKTISIHFLSENPAGELEFYKCAVSSRI